MEVYLVAIFHCIRQSPDSVWIAGSIKPYTFLEFATRNQYGAYCFEVFWNKRTKIDPNGPIFRSTFGGPEGNWNRNLRYPSYIYHKEYLVLKIERTLKTNLLPLIAHEKYV